MGCGESKHAVATANTLTKTESKSKNLENKSMKEEKNDLQVSGNGNTEKINEVAAGKETLNAEVGKEILPKAEEKDGGKENEDVVADDRKRSEDATVVAVEEKKDDIKIEESEGGRKENVAKETADESIIPEEGKSKNVSLDISEGKVEGNDAAEKDGEKEGAVKLDAGEEPMPAEDTDSSGEKKTGTDRTLIMQEKGDAAAPTAD